ncbi:ABC transporter ATP-binding protein [Streptomyces sp. NBC_00582]|uniref:ABC transporter ATP-binding protein n=1 Tax=Streptomyces sp. NBC_00582 TaxID=2975783 RepID=UPI002E8168A7|nr:ABC transporter ATP-binding protein [Streptomyces sp. NBC_00582]WUB67559.1 ABC transporter ATP-binding protein [Streptomyces sp. NBC_00582]
MPADDDVLLSVRNLTVRFGTGRRTTTAVRDVSFDLRVGETLGLVGESGSGKTTVSRALLGLVPVAEGRILFRGEDITHLRGRSRRALAQDIQVVFQDPYGSFNPLLKVSQSLREGLEAAGAPRAEAHRRMTDLLDRVGLPHSAADTFPSQFSGGQRQRLAIARALMPSPSLVICDEAVSALDVSVQAQVLNLLRELRRDNDLSYLFIGHNLHVVRYMSDRVLVMYRGQLVEQGAAEDVVARPRHPYTRALVAAIPEAAVDAPRVTRAPQRGRPTGPGEAVGCPFAPQCPDVIDLCRTDAPRLLEQSDGRSVACHRSGELPAGSETHSETASETLGERKQTA